MQVDSGAVGIICIHIQTVKINHQKSNKYIQISIKLYVF